MTRDEYIAQRVLHQHVEHFTRRWSPAHPRDRADFHADLIALVQAVHRDAMIPVERALATIAASLPPVTFLGPKDKLKL